MAHTGTIDLGRQAQPASGRNPMLAGFVLVVVAFAAVAAVWFATSSGLTAGLAAKPAADRAYDQIEAQRGALTLSADRSYDSIEKLRGGIVAAQADATGGWSAGQYDVVRLPAVTTGAPQMTSGTFHAFPLTQATVWQLTSGTFHVGLPSNQAPISTYHITRPVAQAPIAPLGDLKSIENPVTRDRIGGP